MTETTDILQTLKAQLVGDGQSPDLFFVTREGSVVTITRDFQTALHDWQRLANSLPRIACALEDRLFGCIASVAGPSQDGERLMTDESGMFLQMYPAFLPPRTAVITRG